MKKIAVVILNWNGRKLLEKFLPSFVKFSTNETTEIIVADNASTDDSINYIKENFPQIKIITLDVNWGFAKGYNLALEQVKSKYYVLLNSDVEVTEGWLKSPIEILENNENIAAVQPKILSFNQKDTFEHAGAAGGFIDKFGYPFCRGRILNLIEKDNGQYDNIKEIFWASGTTMFIKADVFHQFFGFDNRFFAHMEEIDLCWRLKNAGFRVFYTPNSKVYHVGGGKLAYNNPVKIYLNFRNSLFMIYKNTPRNQLFYIIFSRLFLDGLSALVFLLQLKFSFFWAVLKAHIAFYFDILDIQKVRKQARKTAIHDHHPEMFSKSIIWSFFIKKIKVFSEIKF